MSVDRCSTIALVFVLVMGCGGASSAPSKPVVTSPELSPALAPLNWWLGDWTTGPDCSTTKTGPVYDEHWLAVSGAMYGVGFNPEGGFEVMVVDDGDDKLDGVLRFIAMPMGARAVEFSQRELGKDTVTFVNPAHDDPKAIVYARDGEGLRAVLTGETHTRVDFCPGGRERAPELEEADRAFSADTSARGIEGWMAGFEPKGGMMRRGARVEGAGIRALMEPLLGKGKLVWEPFASGRHGATLGFTVGKATFTGTDPADTWRSSYVTIWRKQPDGAWKVWFDTGRPVHEN